MKRLLKFYQKHLWKYVWPWTYYPQRAKDDIVDLLHPKFGTYWREGEAGYAIMRESYFMGVNDIIMKMTKVGHLGKHQAAELLAMYELQRTSIEVTMGGK